MLVLVQAHEAIPGGRHQQRLSMRHVGCGVWLCGQFWCWCTSMWPDLVEGATSGQACSMLRAWASWCKAKSALTLAKHAACGLWCVAVQMMLELVQKHAARPGGRTQQQLSMWHVGCGVPLCVQCWCWCKSMSHSSHGLDARVQG
jgi:hypothetical protein